MAVLVVEGTGAAEREEGHATLDAHLLHYIFFSDARYDRGIPPSGEKYFFRMTGLRNPNSST